jgi:hypothetical protein
MPADEGPNMASAFPSWIFENIKVERNTINPRYNELSDRSEVSAITE